MRCSGQRKHRADDGIDGDSLFLLDRLPSAVGSDGFERIVSGLGKGHCAALCGQAVRNGGTAIMCQ